MAKPGPRPQRVLKQLTSTHPNGQRWREKGPSMRIFPISHGGRAAATALLGACLFVQVAPAQAETASTMVVNRSKGITLYRAGDAPRPLAAKPKLEETSLRYERAMLGTKTGLGLEDAPSALRPGPFADAVRSFDVSRLRHYFAR